MTRRRRRTWKLWEEGRAPELIVEVASQTTYELDLGSKRDIYRDVFRTSEYVVFDPEGKFVGEPADGEKPELVVRDLDLDLIETVRNRWQFYRDRRPDQSDDLVQA